MATTVKERSDIVISTLSNLYDDTSYRHSHRAVKEHCEQRKAKDATIMEGFPYILSSKYHIDDVLHFLHLIHNEINKKGSLIIADFGSGDGYLLAFMRRYLLALHKNLTNVEAIGIEYNKAIQSCSYTIRIRHEDFFETPHAFINQLDIMYAYNPLIDSQHNLALVDKIMTSMKSEAYFIFSTAYGEVTKGLMERGFMAVRKHSSVLYYKKP